MKPGDGKPKQGNAGEVVIREPKARIWRLDRGELPFPMAARVAAPAKPAAPPPAPVASPKPVAPSGAAPAVAKQEPPTNPPARPKLKLTDRDRHLMGMLATVRYLSMEQLRRLVFAERNGINLHKRLLALAGEGRYGVELPYLKKVSYRNWEGMPQAAWTLTALGYTVAASVLPTPPRRPPAEAGASFIEHGLMLNELYVQLLEAPLKAQLAAARASAQKENRPSRSFTRVKAGLYARAAHPAFRWHAHDEVRLPWREYARKEGKERERIIIPDATLELPGDVILRDEHGKGTKVPGLRIFLEAETGSHTIVAEGDTKPGATLNKLDRYTTYINGFGGHGTHGDRSTWYTKEFSDGFEPTLLFLVRSASRQELVNQAITEHQRRPGQWQIRAEALTVERAAAKYGASLGAAPAPAPAPAEQRAPRFTSGEFRWVLDLAVAEYHVIKRCRADARARNAPLPEYPEGVDELNALIAKLSAK